MGERNRVIRITTWIAGLSALAVTLLIPLGYFLVSYRYIAGNLEAEADINSRLVSALINSNPDLWQYEQLRLEELLAGRPGSGEREARRIVNLQGKTVAESVTPLLSPIITRSYELHAVGQAAGRIEISRSLQPLLVRTGVVAVISFCFGLLSFVVLRVVPLRAIERAEEQLHRLNDELELKVRERTGQLVAAQEELVRKEKLAILGQLSGSVGHELRNPLGVMSNAVYFLQMVLTDANETTKEYLGIIRQEIDNSLRIISDLLDFARTKTPQVDLVKIPELVTASVGKCVVPGNVEIRLETPEYLPAIITDPLQMQQVLQNLITNSIQAMPQGGEICVTAQANGNSVAICVKDTGEGISPEGLKRLFQPLFTTKTKGIGLGLVVCRNLVEANGGSIEAESTLGEGTMFTVMLPIARGEHERKGESTCG